MLHTFPTTSRNPKTYIYRRIDSNAKSLMTSFTVFTRYSSHILRKHCFPGYTYNLNNTQMKVLNSVAPQKTRKRTLTKSAPWFSDSTYALKKICRKLERKWRMTKQESDHSVWAVSYKSYKHALSAARITYFSNWKLVFWKLRTRCVQILSC